MLSTEVLIKQLENLPMAVQMAVHLFKQLGIALEEIAQAIAVAAKVIYAKTMIHH